MSRASNAILPNAKHYPCPRRAEIWSIVLIYISCARMIYFIIQFNYATSLARCAFFFLIMGLQANLHAPRLIPLRPWSLRRSNWWHLRSKFRAWPVELHFLPSTSWIVIATIKYDFFSGCRSGEKLRKINFCFKLIFYICRLFWQVIRKINKKYYFNIFLNKKIF